MTSNPHSKPDFWRIRNIKTHEKDSAQEWLTTQVKNLSISEGQGYSLAPDSERTLCATLTSFDRPKPSSHSWRVDRDFVGFTPLSDPENPTVDVVAVTGLGGHAVGSFRSADGTVVWLRDFAPEAIPQARFVTYGYDTAVVQSDNTQGIYELARTLLDGLTIFRQRTQTRQRPLLFVCHSLGGVVLKEALVQSSKSIDPKHKKLLEVVSMTYGLVFMGVPNLGLRHDKLMAVVKDRANEALIKNLLVTSDGEASQFLSYLTNEFSSLDSRQKLPFEIVSYYETRKSPTIAASDNGLFATEGPTELMVTQVSAERIGHLIRNIDHLPSNANHRDLVRFDHPQDDRYVSMIEKLKEMAAKAPSALPSPTQISYSEGEAQALIAWSDLLSFPGMGHRLRKLEQTQSTPGTCGWLFEHKKYQAWETNSDSSPPTLLLEGKAGSGKSILVQKAFARAEAMYLDSDCLCLSHFFDATEGGALTPGGSPIGLYRSMLSQLLTKTNPSPDVVALVSAWKPTNKVSPEEMEDTTMLKKKISCLLATQHGKTVRIFIDAIDECAKHKDGGTANTVDLIRYMQDLNTPYLNIQGTSVLVLFSLRDRAQFGSYISMPTIEVSNHNRHDIVRYLDDNLRYSSDAQVRKQLIQTLLHRSSNVFLWVKLVVERVNLKDNSGLTDTELKQELNRIPRELEGIYKGFLDELSSEDRAEALTLLQLVQVCMRPLDLLEIRSALQVARGTEDGPADLNIPANRIEDRIRRICRGFIEVQAVEDPFDIPRPYHNRLLRSNSGSGESCELSGSNERPALEPQRLVQFTHESVRDFLNSYGWGKLENESSQYPTALRAHREVARLCMRAANHGQTPFLPYASQFWTAHARNANEAIGESFKPPKFVTHCNHSTSGFVRRFKTHSNEFRSLYHLQRVDIAITDWLADNATMLMLLAFEGCGKLIKKHDKCTRKDCLENVSTLQTAFALAILRGWTAAVEAARDLAEERRSMKLDPPILDPTVVTNGICPLRWICRHGQHEVLKVIMNMDWDKSSKEARYAFHEAVIRGHGGVVELFLNHAGDDVIDLLSWQSPKGSALHFAASAGRRRIFDMLLERLDDVPPDLLNIESKEGRTVLGMARWGQGRHFGKRQHNIIIETIEDQGGR